jgi:hypothetical protein
MGIDPGSGMVIQPDMRIDIISATMAAIAAPDGLFRKFVLSPAYLYYPAQNKGFREAFPALI